jgi:hypothetical protein
MIPLLDLYPIHLHPTSGPPHLGTESHFQTMRVEHKWGQVYKSFLLRMGINFILYIHNILV